MNILFVDASARKDSRTKILADYLLSKLKGNIETIKLSSQKLMPLDEQSLAKRNALIGQKRFDDPMFDNAKKFIAADVIVICAPYWDFSFPAMLKTFIEHINVGGLVFQYGQNGEIISLCKAKTLYYVTTMGGHNPTDFGFGYIKALANTLYGISDTRLIKAEGLDIIGNDIDAILKKAKTEIDDINF